MEANSNLSQGSSPPSSDPDMEGSCRRTMASETSGLTVDNYRTSIHEEEEEDDEMDSLMAGSTFTGWTDEKHSLYLNSMEELFVKQLQDQKDLLYGHSKNENTLQKNSSGQLNENNSVSSCQFKVLWDGCWQKIKCERIQTQSVVGAGHHGLSNNPRLQHFRCASKQRDVKSAIPNENASLFTKTVCLRRTNRRSCGVLSSPKQLLAEVSDQNFTEEYHEVEKCSNVCSPKRMKTVADDFSRKDQVVVPDEKFSVTADFDDNCASLRAEAAGSSGTNQEIK